jgi:hypothetical protein
MPHEVVCAIDIINVEIKNYGHVPPLQDMISDVILFRRSIVSPNACGSKEKFCRTALLKSVLPRRNGRQSTLHFFSSYYYAKNSRIKINTRDSS